MVINLATFPTTTGSGSTCYPDEMFGRYGLVTLSTGLGTANTVEIYGRVDTADTWILVDTINTSKAASVVALFPQMYAKCTAWASAHSVRLVI